MAAHSFALVRWTCLALSIVVFMLRTGSVFGSETPNANHRSSSFQSRGPHSTKFGSTGPVSSEESDYYKLLGLQRGCSLQDIKTAYRRKAVTMHPDKGGDEEAFKRLVGAYEILSDEQKRKVYDRYGKEGLSGQSSGGDDSFRDMFRGFQPFGFQLPVVYNLELTLEDLYRGKELVVHLNKEQVSVKIAPGMATGTQLRADLAQGQKQVIFVLQQRRHPVFTRRRHDLVMILHIPLIDSLLGFEKSIVLLDGTSVTVSNPPNHICRSGETLVASGMGMPVYGSSRRGDLLVQLEVDSPQSLSSASFSAEDRAVLQRIFGVSSSARSSSSNGINTGNKSSKRVTLQATSVDKFGKDPSKDLDEDDDDDRSGFGEFSFLFR